MSIFRDERLKRPKRSSENVIDPKKKNDFRGNRCRRFYVRIFEKISPTAVRYSFAITLHVNASRTITQPYHTCYAWFSEVRSSREKIYGSTLRRARATPCNFLRRYQPISLILIALPHTPRCVVRDPYRNDSRKIAPAKSHARHVYITIPVGNDNDSNNGRTAKCPV